MSAKILFALVLSFMFLYYTALSKAKIHHVIVSWNKQFPAIIEVLLFEFLTWTSLDITCASYWIFFYAIQVSFSLNSDFILRSDQFTELQNCVLRPQETHEYLVHKQTLTHTHTHTHTVTYAQLVRWLVIVQPIIIPDVCPARPSRSILAAPCPVMEPTSTH